MRLSQVKAFSTEGIKDCSSKHLCQGDKVVSDGLNCFNGFGDAGFSHRIIITGGGAKSVEVEDFKWVNTIISNVKRSVLGTFHAISKRHFPRYLAEFCYWSNRRFDLRQIYLSSPMWHSGCRPSPRSS
ncbi:IS1595 family transposase [Desulfogranum marinum]|uniref:IS1595 family transposase n=1 Tax=Desulfogranum marinum TaxID=453220 RepID=UPI001963017D|nr:IS1595 family transposase [Desulfogranum marinum]